MSFPVPSSAKACVATLALATMLVSGPAGSVGCARLAIKRDLSTTPAGQVGFDDMCDLQGYFDSLEMRTSPPPRVVQGVDLEKVAGPKPVRGGRERFVFDGDFLLKALRRVLRENWRSVPEEIDSATEVELEVTWSEKAGSKRVVTTEPAEIAAGNETWTLPYHVCLSELLYGEQLYRQRRVMWNLPSPRDVPPPTPAPNDGDVASGP